MLNNSDLVAYLLDERRRRILNWRGIENLAGLGKGRIKNVCLYKKGEFRTSEIEALNEVLASLK
jgi:hypothetical protein